MKLVTDYNPEVRVLTEENEPGVKTLYIEGVYLQADITNRNGRVYPMAVLEAEVRRYTKEFVNNNRAVGELNHPTNPQINLDRVSHRILSLKREGKDFIGRSMILNTPQGKIAQGLIEGGTKLGVSSRGLGSLEEKNGVNYVREDYKIVTAADIVHDPSAPSAFVQGIMEGKEWVYQGSVLIEMAADQIKREILRTPNRKLEEAKLNSFKRFMDILSRSPNS